MLPRETHRLRAGEASLVPTQQLSDLRAHGLQHIAKRLDPRLRQGGEVRHGGIVVGPHSKM